MTNEQLSQYIKAQKSAGYPEQLIKDMLIARGWSVEVVAAEFESLEVGKDKLKSDSRLDQRALSDMQAQTTPDKSGAQINEPNSLETELEPDRYKKWKNIFGVMFFMLASLYFEELTKVAGTAYLMKKTMVVVDFPLFFASPYLYGILLIVSSYLFFKVRNFSARTLKLTTYALVGLFLLGGIYRALLMMFFVRLGTLEGNKMVLSIVGVPEILILIIGVMLYLNRGKFQEEEKAFKKKQRVLMVLEVIFTLGIVGIYGIYIVKAGNLLADTYQETVETVGFPVREVGNNLWDPERLPVW